MAGEQPQQFSPAVAGSAEDNDIDNFKSLNESGDYSGYSDLQNLPFNNRRNRRNRRITVFSH
jgi:hypothetical protein